MKPNKIFAAAVLLAISAAAMPALADSTGQKAEQTAPQESGFGDSYFANTAHPAFSDPAQDALLAYDGINDPAALDGIEPAAGDETGDDSDVDVKARPESGTDLPDGESGL